jgi:hypothetical protein
MKRKVKEKNNLNLQLAIILLLFSSIATQGSSNRCYIVPAEVSKKLIRNNVWWYEFSLINESDFTIKSPRIEVRYSRYMHPLQSISWKGKIGFKPQEYATKDESNRRVYFDLPEIFPRWKTKMWVAFMAEKTGTHYFSSRILAKSPEGSWVEWAPPKIPHAVTEVSVPNETTIVEPVSVIDPTNNSDTTESVWSTSEIFSSLNLYWNKCFKIIKENYPSLIIVFLLLLIFITLILIYSQLKTQRKLMEPFVSKPPGEARKVENHPTTPIKQEVELSNQKHKKQKVIELKKESKELTTEKPVLPEEQHRVDDEKQPEDDLGNLYRKLDELTKS